MIIGGGEHSPTAGEVCSLARIARPSRLLPPGSGWILCTAGTLLPGGFGGTGSATRRGLPVATVLQVRVLVTAHGVVVSRRVVTLVGGGGLR